MQSQSVPSGAPSVAFPFTERHVQHVLPHTHLSKWLQHKAGSEIAGKSLEVEQRGRYKIQLNGQRAAAPYAQPALRAPVAASYNIFYLSSNIFDLGDNCHGADRTLTVPFEILSSVGVAGPSSTFTGADCPV